MNEPVAPRRRRRDPGSDAFAERLALASLVFFAVFLVGAFLSSLVGFTGQAWMVFGDGLFAWVVMALALRYEVAFVLAVAAALVVLCRRRSRA